jgi:uncharacterized protein (UPF0333 family)
MIFIKKAYLKSTSLERWMALVSVVSLILAVCIGLKGSDRSITIIIVAAFFLVVFIIFLFQVTRSSFEIYGYNEVMNYLELLAKNAQKRVWTVRTHVGNGEMENKYFEIIEHRLLHPDAKERLEDFRRVICLSSNAEDHLNYLVDRFSNLPAAEVRFYIGGGPKFDFLIIDELAVIGFPMIGGKNNTGAIVLRKRAAVEGIITVFSELCGDNNSTLLFTGNKQFNSTDKENLRIHIKSLIDKGR